MTTHPVCRPSAASLFPLFATACALAASTATFAAETPSATGESGKPKTDAADVVQLSAFEVKADADNGYGALESTSITRFRTDLSKLPITADVFTETFMNDIAATSVEETVLQFGGAGIQTSDAGANGAFNNSPGDSNGSTAIVLRGQKVSVHRDGFQPATATRKGLVGATDNFSVERGEVIHGASSLLYSNSGGGGVINMVSKQARFGGQPFARLSYRLDRYGGQRATLDTGAGSKKVAVRVALLGEETSSRRVNLDGEATGVYAQAAFKLPLDTTLRIWGQSTLSNNNNSTNNNAINNYLSATDPRRNLALRYLVATNQVSDIPNLFNPGLDLNNVDSFRGWWNANHFRDAYTGLSLETRVNSWLTTQLSAVYDDNQNWSPSGAGSFTPAVTGAFSVGQNPFPTSAVPINTPGLSLSHQRKRGLRFSGLADNRYFGNAIHTQTIGGFETTRERNSGLSYVYAKTDDKGNFLSSGNTASERGLILLNGPLWYSVGNGLNAKPQLVGNGAEFNGGATTGAALATAPVNFKPSQPRIVFTDPKTGQPVYYALVARRIADPAAITATNPFGVVGNNGNYNQSWVESHGYYVANVTEWFGGKVETLSGLRYSEQYSQNTGVTIVSAQNTKNYSEKRAHGFTYTVGASYQLTPWIRPYAGISTSSNPQLNTQSPLGIPNDSSKGQTMDLGVKVFSPDGKLGATIAWSRNFLKDDAVGIDTTYVTAINPTGVNGQYQPLGLAANSQVNVDRKSQAWEARLDMKLTPTWRSSLGLTMTDGTMLNTVSFDQVYNDELNIKNGVVTYANGTPVTVKNTTTQSQIGIDNTAAGIPLTVAMLNTTAGAYSAQPDPDSGSIGNSNLKTLINSAPSTNPIKTGRTGLPISAIQYAFTDPNKHNGVVSPVVAGDKTFGYNRYSVSFVNHYDFTQSWMKGVGVTHVVNVGYQYRSHYYADVSSGAKFINAPRALYVRPTIATMNLGLSYKHKLFGKYNFSTQVNVNNVLNHYRVLFPPTTTGSPVYNSVVFTAEPRQWIWSNSVNF